MLDSLLNFIADYYNSMSYPELISIGVIIGAAVIIITLERLFPYTSGQKFLREGFFNDLALYTIAQSYILGIIIFGGTIYYIDSTTGLSRLGLFSNVPIWIQLIFFTITHDTYIYWMHRWQHKNKWLWRIHEAHHSPTTVDWIAGSRSHAFEILINQTIEFLPIVLLGSPPEVIAYKGVISGVWGMWIHANVNVHTGWLQYIINGPEMHQWHHDVGKGRNRNFSTKFAFWDWMFGTAYLPRPDKPQQFGLKTYFPSNFFQQFLFIFKDSKARKKR